MTDLEGAISAGRAPPDAVAAGRALGATWWIETCTLSVLPQMHLMVRVVHDGVPQTMRHELSRPIGRTELRAVIAAWLDGLDHAANERQRHRPPSKYMKIANRPMERQAG